MCASCRILLVEDDAELRALFQRILTQAGYQVTAVADCEIAKREVRHRPYDLVLTDYHLPGCPGDALICAIRQAGLPISTLLMRNVSNVRDIAARCQADASCAKMEGPLTILPVIARLLHTSDGEKPAERGQPS